MTAPHGMAAEVRSVRIEDELARRGIKLRGRGSERCGPCPQCGGDDRFSINIKDQVFNCRKCGGKGRGAIDLVMFLDGRDFRGAVETLARQAAQPQATAQQPKKTYFDYHDAQGALVYQVERTDYFDGRKKTFRQRRPDPARPGEWLWNITGVPLLLYRLPEVLAAKAHGRTIAIVEGEAKADLLWSWNIPATCGPMARRIGGPIFTPPLCAERTSLSCQTATTSAGFISRRSR
jgi:hypothetical protein